MMSRNTVQFQMGLSLSRFIESYGTEEQCFTALYNWRWPQGFICSNCGHNKGCQLTTRKLQQCYRCHHQTSITAGTIFQATKRPLTCWFQALYLIAQDKKGLSAMALHRHLGISYKAAWHMKHKIMQVMYERDESKPLSGFVELDDAYLGGEHSGLMCLGTRCTRKYSTAEWIMSENLFKGSVCYCYCFQMADLEQQINGCVFLKMQIKWEILPTELDTDEMRQAMAILKRFSE